MRVCVVGAGVLGASVASSLHARGADVVLVEAVAPGGGTSSRGAGLVHEGLGHETSILLARRSLDLLGALSERCREEGLPLRLHTVGGTTLVPQHLLAPARALAALQARCGVDVREVRPDDVAALPRHEGTDVSDVAAAFHYPRASWSLPRLYAEILNVWLTSSGGRQMRAAASLTRDGRAVGVRAGGAGALDADAIVLACGVHTRALLRAVGLDAPLLAYRTQAARVAHPRASDAPILHDAVRGWYMRPGQGGHLVAGNGTTTRSEDPAAWNAEADEAFRSAILARVRARLPFLDAASVADAWAGIDAATPDQLLLAGRHPEAEGLWLCAGGNGHGFMRAPAVGESLAALILGDTPRIALDAYDPARFADVPESFEISEGFALGKPRA